MTRTLSASAKASRPKSNLATDLAALKAIAQAAIDVELFTIPLYMTSLYSIEGMHEINSANNRLYLGRLWPGAKTSAAPANSNEIAFNIVFSVFIQEMLHLQMAANMASVIGIKPDFTSSALQDERHGWTCYGPDKTIIPNIVDLKDTTNEDVPVNVGALDEDRIRLFLAIEQPEEDARKAIKSGNYFPKAPFADWKIGDPLPMFGTIGWMYQCYYDYLSLSYADGSTLWETVWKKAVKAKPVQNDLFNVTSGGHPMREFMGFNTTVALTYKDIAYQQMVAMMDAITDQGEGSELKKNVGLEAVMPRYCPDKDALESDYPSYDGQGQLVDSADAAARFKNDFDDHYERFQAVQALIEDGSLTTWADNPRIGNWQASQLKTDGYDDNPYNDVLPSADDIAGALNRLSKEADSHTLLSQAAIGAIAGVTTVLNDYWSPPAGTTVLFPYPSMSGSGDRMAIAWAVTGKCPDLSIGIDPPVPNILKHACQGLDFETRGKNDCAQVAIFHSCKGSNKCQAQGGCGFVQQTTGGGNCSGSAPPPVSAGAGDGGVLSTRMFGGTCGWPPPTPSTFYSAPSDNKCGTLGGCAVPISASQLYPTEGVMQIFDFKTDDATKTTTSDPICRTRYKIGDAVHDIAYKAFAEVMDYRQTPAEPKPKPNDLRLAFPPST
jgi:ferritin-like protein